MTLGEAGDHRAGRPATTGRNRLPADHLQGWGARLAMARRARGLSQGALARSAGRFQQTVSKIETGECGVGDPLKIALADALGVPPDLLFPLAPPELWPDLPPPRQPRIGGRRT